MEEFWYCCCICHLGVYISLTEINKGAMQKGEIVLFLRSALKKRGKESHKIKHAGDIESGNLDAMEMKLMQFLVRNFMRPLKFKENLLRVIFFFGKI